MCVCVGAISRLSYPCPTCYHAVRGGWQRRGGAHSLVGDVDEVRRHEEARLPDAPRAVRPVDQRGGRGDEGVAQVVAEAAVEPAEVLLELVAGADGLFWLVGWWGGREGS